MANPNLRLLLTTVSSASSVEPSPLPAAPSSAAPSSAALSSAAPSPPLLERVPRACRHVAPGLPANCGAGSGSRCPAARHNCS
ncbi:unnamed protein product [Closterium sp. NIES-54]